MEKSTKIIVTIVIVVVFIAVFGAIAGARGDNGNSTPGIFGLIIFGGMIAAIRAVWKNSNDNSNRSE